MRKIWSLVGIGGALLMSAGLVNAADQEITLGAAGGRSAEIEKEVFQDPFSKATGIKINHVNAEGNRLAQLEAMVAAGNPAWDLVEVSASEYPIAAKKGLLEAVDYAKVDPSNQLPEVARRPYMVVAGAWSHVLTVRTDKQPAGKQMSGWADFWDVEAFPGPRSLRDSPQDTLEYALLADGVPAADLYKVLATDEGLDRAFNKLDEIKPHVTVWWKSGAQAIQLLSDAEVFYGTGFNGRITDLAKSGVPAQIVWNGAAMHLTGYAIPKGATNIEAAQKFLSYRALDVDQMREYIKFLPYPGFAPGVEVGLDPSVSATLPTNPANLALGFSANEEFWAENMDRIRERWTDWLLQ